MIGINDSEIKRGRILKKGSSVKLNKRRFNELKHKKYSLFIVEDNSIVQTILQHTFNSKPHIEPIIFSSGEECVKELSIKPDIAILDYHLSTNPRDLNGLQVLEKIKEHSPDTKIIMLSSQEEVKIAVACLRKGAEDYVIKDEGMRVNTKKAVANIIKNIELKNEIFKLSRKIKRDKLLMKGYFIIFVAMIIMGIFLLN